MIFKTPISQKVTHFKTSEDWIMLSIDPSFKVTDDDFLRIKQICNEPLIYQWLFEENLEGKPYSLDKAKGFIAWAQTGWEKQEYFVFLIRDTNGIIQAAVDIKSNNLAEAEVGYWASSDQPGIMTNAVKTLCDLAQQAGYKKLFSDVQTSNEKSIKVLNKSHFDLEKEFTDNDKDYYRYSKLLNA